MKPRNAPLKTGADESRRGDWNSRSSPLRRSIQKSSTNSCRSPSARRGGCLSPPSASATHASHATASLRSRGPKKPLLLKDVAPPDSECDLQAEPAAHESSGAEPLPVPGGWLWHRAPSRRSHKGRVLRDRRRSHHLKQERRRV